MKPNLTTLEDATLEQMLEELDNRGHQFVWASIAVPDDPETRTLLCRSERVNDAQSLWMLEHAADVVAKQIESEAPLLKVPTTISAQDAKRLAEKYNALESHEPSVITGGYKVTPTDNECNANFDFSKSLRRLQELGDKYYWIQVQKDGSTVWYNRQGEVTSVIPAE